MSNNNDFHVQGPQINQFDNIVGSKHPRSSFKRDYPYRTTFNQDVLVPIFVDEILPGDDLSVRMTALTRVATPIKPIMDNLYLETFWFFVPNRLVWTNWKKFQGEQVNPGDSTAYTIPVLDKTKAPMSTTGFLTESIFDYMGMPTLVTGLSDVSALFNRGIDLIWNEWFRDENLQNSLTIQTGDGPDDPAIYALRKRNKRKDYRTGCLPWPQKGTAVSIPLGVSAPVLSDNTNITLVSPLGVTPRTLDQTSVGVQMGYGGAGISGGSSPTKFANSGLYTDLTGASLITINLLRQSALYQQILELDARGGTRYVESIYSRFGVVSPDFRLQRPELIGQGSTRINIYAVPQTAPTVSGQTPQGNLAAFGTNVINGDHGCRYAATEHGMVIGFANVRADLTYQQALPKMFTRKTRLDFYEPLLNGLGEQAVLNREVMAQGTSADLDPFGYIERFSEYRYRDALITGKMRTNAPGTLNVWNLSQQFASLPGLNSTFITEAVPMARILAVPSEPSFLFDASFDYNHVRVMPMRSNPGIDKL